MASTGFGYKTAWIAAKTDSPTAVANALGLSDQREVPWDQGVAESYEASDVVFVTPPIDGWVMAVGVALTAHADSSPCSVPELIGGLATALGNVETQYFFSHRVVEAHGWARSRAGTIERAYLYIGDQARTALDIGAASAEEIALGFRFFDERLSEAKSDSYWAREDLTSPSEEDVMRLARTWSVDPSSLEDRGQEFPNGICGRLLNSQLARDTEATQASRPWWKFW